MAKSIHIHLHRGPARDAGTAHDPSNGQFTSGQHEKAAGRHADEAVEARGKPGNGAKLHSEAAAAHTQAANSLRTNHPDKDKHVAAAHAATAAASGGPRGGSLSSHESISYQHSKKGNAIRAAGNLTPEKSKLMTQHFSAAKLHREAANAHADNHPDKELKSQQAHGASRLTQR